MAKKRNEIRRNKKVEALKSELSRIDVQNEAYKTDLTGVIKSKINIDLEQLREQINLEINEFTIKGKNGFKILNPKFGYESSPEYTKHLETVNIFLLKTKKKQQAEIEVLYQKEVEFQENQKKLRDGRRTQILDELKALRVNIKQFMVGGDTTYIG